MSLDHLARLAAVFGVALWVTLALEVLIALAFHMALDMTLLSVFMAISLIVAGLTVALWPVKRGKSND